MSKRRITNSIPIEEGSGNVYADLGYADGEAMLIKAQLTSKIAEIIKTRGLTQAETAEKLGLTQPKGVHSAQRSVSWCLRTASAGLPDTAGPGCPDRHQAGA